jgi:hypothetical protein
MIKRNIDELEEVYIFTTVSEKTYHNDHFIPVSKLSWILLEKFNLGGIKIGLF